MLPWHVRKVLRLKSLKPIQKASLTASLNLTNPSSVDYLTLELPTLISELDQEQQRAVQQILLDGITQGNDAEEIAQQIKDSVGLTQQQAEWVSNFRDQLESGVDDGLTPVAERRLSATDANMAQDEFDAAETDPDTVDLLVDKYRSSLLSYRALGIAVTEIHAASIQGQDDIWHQAVDQGFLNPDITERHWLGVGHDREREDHIATEDMNEPAGVGIDEPFDTPVGPVMNPGESGDDDFDINCFLPDTPVRGEFVSGLKSLYSGEAIEIITDGNRRLSVTPNHPILTEKGFILARNLTEKDNLVCDGFIVDKTFTGDIHKQNRPALVQDVIQALIYSGGTRPVPSSARFDFHGDEKFLNGNIHQVGADRQLGNRYFTSFFQTKFYFSFITAHINKALRVCDSLFNFIFHGSVSSLCSSVGSRNLVQALDGSKSLPFKPLRIGLGSKENSVFLKHSSKRGPTDIIFNAQLVDRYPRKVCLDKVRNIRRFPFVGSPIN